MTAFARKLVFSATAACFALALSATPAVARTTHHKHHVKHRITHHAQAPASSPIVRIAQDHLSHIGYYKGKSDGIMGPQTRAAIRNFQREQGLKADGALGPKTNAALEKADHHAEEPQQSFNVRQGVGVGDGEIAPDYAPSLSGSKLINTRYGGVDVSESGEGSNKRYNVNLNGQSILTADGQPTVMGISPTFDLGQEDAVIFTTYSPSDANCMYKTHVLTLSTTGSSLVDIDNCTRGYHAEVNGGSLYVSFPEHDDNRALGATWRVEGMTAEKL